MARGRKWTFTFSEKNNERQSGSYCGNVFTVCGFHGPRGCATYDEGWSGRTTRVLWNERPSLYVHAPLCTGCTVQTNSIYRQPACLPGCNFVELSATSTTFSRETFSFARLHSRSKVNDRLDQRYSLRSSREVPQINGLNTSFPSFPRFLRSEESW